MKHLRSTFIMSCCVNMLYVCLSAIPSKCTLFFFSRKASELWECLTRSMRDEDPNDRWE